MNTGKNMHDSRPMEPEIFDRMVDGELNEAEQRALLTRLETEPEGWRRLALAFLEAQTWGRELRGIVAGEGDSVSSPRPATSQVLPARPLRALLVAASCLLALGLGFVLGSFRHDKAPSTRDAIVDRYGAGQGLSGGRVDRRKTEEPVDVAVTDAKAKTRHRRAEQPGTLHLLVSDPTSSRIEPVEIPLIPASEVGQEILRTPETILPRSIQRAWERLGHRIDQERYLCPILLDDGRQVVVPVDDVRVRYVGDRPFQ